MFGKTIGQMVSKARCINFELWFLHEHEQDLVRIYQTLEVLIKQDIDEAVRDGCNTVIGLLLYEGFLYKNSEDFYSLLQRVYAYGTEKGIEKFFLACGIVWDYQTELHKRKLNYEILEFDYSANAMWESYKHYPLPNWNNNTNKFLFLGGVPSRKNRITLLSYFYDDNLLKEESALWSFFLPIEESEKEKCRALCSNYTDDQYQTFLIDAENKIDSKYYETKEYSKANGVEWRDNQYLNTEFFQDPNYINQNVFLSTSISVIAEGHVYPPANDFRFLTEKTWRAVINRHPFILADCEQRKQFARDRGLDLFEDYFKFPYDSDLNLINVVNNIKHFLEIKNKYSEEIRQKVNNNFSAFFSIINKNECLLKTLETKYNVPSSEIKKWFRQKSFDHLFRIPDYKK